MASGTDIRPEARYSESGLPTSDDSLSSSNEKLLDNHSVTKKVALGRELGLIHAVSVVVGIVIGGGIFASPTVVLKASGSVGLSLIVWVACGLVCSMCALCYIELGLMINKGGAEFAFFTEAYGGLAGFMWLVVTTVFIEPSSVSMISLTLGHYVIETVDPSCSEDDREEYAKLVAYISIMLAMSINCISTKVAANVQVVFTIAKVLAIAILVLVGAVRVSQGHTQSFQNPFHGSDTNILDIGLAFYGGLFAYGGWSQLYVIVEELKEPGRNLPRGVLLGLTIVIVCYVTANVSYLSVLSPSEFQESNAVASAVGRQVMGIFHWVLPALVACSCFGTINGSTLTDSRLYYLGSREGVMPRLLVMLQRHTRTPVPALILNALIPMLMLIPKASNFETLLRYNGYIYWLSIGVSVSTVFWFRWKKPELKRPFKVFIGIPIFVLLCCVYFTVTAFAEAPIGCTIVTLIIVMIAPVYLIFIRYRCVPSQVYTAFDKFTYFMQALMGLSMPEEDPIKD